MMAKLQSGLSRSFKLLLVLLVVAALHLKICNSLEERTVTDNISECSSLQSGSQCIQCCEAGTPEPTCSAWMKPTHSTINSSSVECECGNTLNGLVYCDVADNTILVLPCYCMSQSKLLNKTIIGSCPYSCNTPINFILSTVKHSELDNQTCQPFKRTGQLCGDCMPGYAPPVYSYNIECVQCTDYDRNWLKYITIAFLPLTIFYAIIVVCGISVISNKLRCFVFVCQVLTMPAHLRLLYALKDDHNNMQQSQVEVRFAEMGLSLFSIWNLDFFRALYPPFCIHPQVGSLGVLALDYLTAVYPFLLICITYCCVKLHNYFRIVQWMLKPFLRCCSYFRKEWQIRQTLIETLATFIVLSYVKILSISFELLCPTNIFDMNGEKSISFLYSSGSVEIFKGEHIPFAMLAIFMLIVFNIMPLVLLCLYPTNCIQKVMNSCNCRWQTLHIYMDIFLGCYRAKPTLCKYFSVLYLFLRVTNIIVLATTLNSFYYPLAAVFALVATALVTIVQPYESHLYNKIDTILLLVLVYSFVSLAAYVQPSAMVFRTTLIIMICLAAMILLAYIISVVVYQVMPHKFKQQFTLKINRLYQSREESEPATAEEELLETIDYDSSLSVSYSHYTD